MRFAKLEQSAAKFTLPVISIRLTAAAMPLDIIVENNGSCNFINEFFISPGHTPQSTVDHSPVSKS